MTAPRLRIGTRGSPLALAQTELVCRALAGAHPELAAPGALEVVAIRTTGDRVTDRPLAELGGKGLFCKEIEAALLARRIDLAVHSMKDLPTWLPDGLIDRRGAAARRSARRADRAPGAPPSPSCREARRGRHGLAAPQGAAAGAAPGPAGGRLPRQRRHPAAQARGRRGRRDPAGAAPACDRLGLEPSRQRGADARRDAARGRAGRDRHRMPRRRCGDPARCSRRSIIRRAAPACAPSARCSPRSTARATRRSPAMPRSRGGRLHLRALVARPDGSECLRAERAGPPGDAERLGRDAGAELRARAGPAFFD